MAFRAPNAGVYSTGKRTYNAKKKTYTGPGKAPAGYKKVPRRDYTEIPTVTTDVSSGTATTSGFPSQGAARRAERRQRTAVRTQRRKTRALASTRRSAAQRRAVTSQNEARVKSTERAVKADSQRVRTAPKFSPAPKSPAKAASKAPKAVRQPANAVKSPLLAASTKPKAFKGRRTAGSPSLKELQVADKQGTLKENERGYLTTPKLRRATRELKRAKAAVRKSEPRMAGLAPEEREVVKYARKAHRKYPDVPTSTLMSLTRQESGFQADAVSSAAAQGLTQFIPSTAAAYGVQYGTGRREKQSQLTGAAKLLHDNNFASDPKGALTNYTGGYSDAEYNDPVLEGAADYAALDKPGNPKAAKRLKRAKAKAADLGLAGALTKGKQPVPKKVLTRFKAAQTAAKELEKAALPYVWGGGHGDPASRPTGGGLDCSGAVSYVLNKMGAMKGSLVSGEMGSVLKPGPGAVTVFYNAGHTFMRIGNRYFGTSSSNPAGGAGFIEGTPDLSSYSVGHVPGLGKKVAVALGVPLTGGSFPGMSLSSGGTTATIESGAGATKGKPGFSSKPIKLTPTQKARRKFRRLREAGVGTGTAAGEEETSPTLRSLEAKYGVKTG